MNFMRLLLSALVCCLTGTLMGQQLSLFTQYRENATLINPAAMELDFLAFGYPMTVGASYRKQWSGINGSPTTQTLRFSYVNAGRSAANLIAGGYVINDQTGPTGFTGFYGRVGAVLGADVEYSGLSLAISGGYVGYRVRASELVLRDGGDVLGSSDQTQSHPDVGFGAYFYNTVGSNDNQIFLGLSVPQLLGFDLTYTNEAGEYNVERVRHYYALAGTILRFRNESFLELSAWGKYVEGAPFNADFNMRYQMNNALYLGTGLSTAGNFHVEAGVNLGPNSGLDNNIRIGYGADYSFSSFGPSVGGTHEIQISMAFDR